MHSLWLDTHDPSHLPSHTLPPEPAYDVAIAGAGLTGLATAVQIARTGRSVVVLEARTVGAVATGNTTAKLTLLQGMKLSSIREQHSLDVAAAYLEANRAGRKWLLELCGRRGVDVQHRPASTYAVTADGAHRLREELETARELGLDTQWSETGELPFTIAGAVTLDDQIQFHPMQVLTALAQEFASLGGTLVEGVRVTGAGRRGPLTLETTAGPVEVGHLVLATGIPSLDRGGHAMRMSPNRSYALTFRVPTGGFVPHGMHISADGPTRTLRSVPVDGEELLLVGGNDHVTGNAPDSPAARIADLEEWTQHQVPGVVRTHAWAAQDYEPAAGLPLIGALPGSDGTILAATGYAKWGMANAVAAAQALTGLLEDAPPSWHETMDGSSGGLRALAASASTAARVGTDLVGDWTAAELRPLPEQSPGEGDGVVGRSEGRPVAVSTVDGRRCAISAICTHMGGLVRWNDAERSWDCPLHGSRFAPDGSVLEGPATRPLGEAP